MVLHSPHPHEVAMMHCKIEAALTLHYTRIKEIIPVQDNPSPVNPELQIHLVNLPLTFLQFALTSQMLRGFPRPGLHPYPGISGERNNTEP